MYNNNEGVVGDMAESIFTRIIERQEPAEVLYEDEQAIIILSRAPLKPGHSLVIPKVAYERFYDMDADVYVGVMKLSRRFAQVLDAVFEPTVVALQLMGLGVPHVHVHLVPIDQESDMDPARAVFGGLDELKPAADKIRAYLADNPLADIQ